MINIKPLFFPLLLLMIWGPPSFRMEQLDTALNDPAAATDLSTVYRVAVWAVAGLVLGYYIFRHWLYRGRLLPGPLTRGALKWYGLFAIFAVISASYSLRPAFTLFFAGKLVISWIAIGLYTNISDQSLTVSTATTLLKAFYFVMIGQWVLIVIFYFVRPEIVGYTAGIIGYRLTGGIFNDFGLSAAIAGIFFLTKVVTRKSLPKRLLYGALYGLTCIFILFSLTRTTMVIALVCAFMIIGFQRKFSFKFLAVWSTLLFSCLVILYDGGQLLGRFILRGQTLEGFQNLTGRTTAFRYLINHWQDSPILGYGYEAGHRIIMLGYRQATGGSLTIAHDVVSRVLIDLGIVGGSLLLITVIAACVELLQVWRLTHGNHVLRSITLQLLALMALSLISGFSGSAIAGLYWPMLVVLGTTPSVKRLALAVARRSPQNKMTAATFIENPSLAIS